MQILKPDETEAPNLWKSKRIKRKILVKESTVKESKENTSLN